MGRIFIYLYLLRPNWINNQYLLVTIGLIIIIILYIIFTIKFGIFIINYVKEKPKKQEIRETHFFKTLKHSKTHHLNKFEIAEIKGKQPKLKRSPTFRDDFFTSKPSKKKKYGRFIFKSTTIPQLPPKFIKPKLINLSTQSIICGVCLGVIKTGETAIKCECGKYFHISCGKRLGECPKCYSGFRFRETFR